MKKGLHITKLLLGVALLSSFVVAFLTYRHQYFRLGAEIVSRELSRVTGGTVLVGSLDGTVFDELILRDVRFVSPDSLRLAAGTIRLRYSVADLLRSPRTVRAVEIDTITVALAPQSREDGPSGDGGVPRIALFADTLLFKTVVVRGEEGGVEEAHFSGSFLPRRGGFRLFVGDARGGVVAGGHRFAALLGGTIDGDPVNGTLAADVRGTFGGARFAYTGEHRPGDRFAGEGRLVVDSLDAIPFLRAFAAEAEIDSAGGVMTVAFRGSVDSCAIVLDGRGSVDRFTADTLHVESKYARGTFDIERIEGVMNGAFLVGEGLWRFGSPDSEGEPNRFSLRFRHVDAAHFAPGIDRSSDLSGEVSWKGRGTDLTRLSGQIDVSLVESRVGDIAIRRASIRGSAFPGGLTIERSEILTAKSQLGFGGVVRLDGTIEGDVSATIPSLAEFRSLTPFDTLGGSARINGSVSGTLERLHAEGEVEIDSAFLEAISFESVDMNGWLDYDGGALEAGGEALCRALRGGDDRIDSLRVEVTLGGDTLRLENLSAWRREWSLLAGGMAMVTDSSRFIDLRDIHLRRGEETIARLAHVRIWKKGDRLGIDPLSFPFGEGTVSARAVRGPDEAIDAAVEAAGCDLSLLSDRIGIDRRFLRDVDLTVSVGGTLDDPTGSLFLDLRGAAQDSLPFRELTAAGRFADSHILLDSAVVLGHARGARLKASGTIPLPPDRPGGRIAIDLSLRRYPLAELHFLSDKIEPFEGNGTADLRLSGSWAEPLFEGHFDIDSTMWNDFPMGRVRGDSIRYGGDSLVAVLRLDDSWGKGNRLFWRLPARLDPAGKDFSFLDTGPFRASLHIPRGDFGLVFALTDLVEDASGTFSLDVTLEGDRSSPSMDGVFELEDGFILPAEVAAYFEDVRARILIDEDYLTIVSASARSGKKGRIDAWGRVDIDHLVPAGYDLEARAKGYEILLADGPDGTIRTTFDGELEVTTDDEYFDRLVPHISGTVDLRELLLEIEFREPEEGVPTVFDPTARPAWTCDIQVNAPKKITVRNSVLDAELGGEARITKSAGGFGAVGDFDIFRGTYWVLNNQFRNVEGRLVFGDPYDMRNVDIDATARTEVLGERIDVGVTGHPDSLVVSSSSESGMTEEEILAMLTVRAMPEKTVNSGELLSSWLTSFANRFSREVAHGLGDMGTIEIGTSDDLPEIRYGNYFSNDLFLGFSQKLRSPLDTPSREQGPYRENLPVPDRQVRVEYRLRRSLVVQGEAGTFDDGGRFVNVDLKVKLPY